MRDYICRLFSAPDVRLERINYSVRIDVCGYDCTAVEYRKKPCDGMSACAGNRMVFDVKVMQKKQ